MNRIDLDGGNAIVTGGARGIVLAIAERLLASGAAVTLWDHDGAELEKARARLAIGGGHVQCSFSNGAVCDLSGGRATY